ncbi:S-layer homology domain-containing protein [Dethiosulfatibacter aminovorans DSM 17477]|uniref:S-layer homology domain-containing protein n=1 Tax=Dethiosulfatibacter aminovorans DSM 17477 TaxID=1121476 RepID=A0A1M6E860_9FIRM|nr:S-layer homology domain-containing protein [Dethiosulfatibacter aminovorans]SHI81631.1 S-layer homology domain-containing protein [Dethiosulfatibacter aminovorans DSM 17477]
MKIKYSIKTFIIILLLIMFSSQTAFSFTDLDENNPNTSMIMEFYERGLTKGYPDGTFRPQGTITRAEFVTFINRTFGYKEEAESLPFSDVTGEEWFSGQLKVAIKKGFIEGYPDGTFRPEKPISRQEVAVILNGILLYPADEFTDTEDEIASWAIDSVNALLQRDIMMLHEGKFLGDESAVRESVVVSLLKTLHIKEEEDLEAEDTEAEDTDDGESSSGGSSSGSSSSGGSSSGGSSSGGSSSGGSSGNDDDDDPPEYDIPSDETVYSLNMTVLGLEKVLEGDTEFARKLDENSLKIVSDIKESMENYLDDYGYDYETEVNKVKTEYNSLEEDIQSDIEIAIKASVPAEHLNTLEEFFSK